MAMSYAAATLNANSTDEVCMYANPALAIDPSGARATAVASLGASAVEGPLASLLRLRALRPVFQPIACLRDGTVYAHEALIRGPKATSFEFPDVLLRAAAQEGLGWEFELSLIHISEPTRPY